MTKVLRPPIKSTSMGEDSNGKEPMTFAEPAALHKVSEFHRLFRHPIGMTPGLPSEERCLLRINLLQEELNELKEALANRDLVEAADALCDLQYVLSGAIHELGLGDVFAELFGEVHRSNMSKACQSLDEAQATVLHYQERHNIECDIETIDGLHLVYRRSDRKTLKSVAYSPADLASRLPQTP